MRIRQPIAVKILDGEILAGDTVEVDADLKKGEVKFERELAKAAKR